MAIDSIRHAVASLNPQDTPLENLMELLARATALLDVLMACDVDELPIRALYDYCLSLSFFIKAAEEVCRLQLRAH